MPLRRLAAGMFCDLRRLVTDTCREGSFGAATLVLGRFSEGTFGAGMFAVLVENTH